MTQRVEVYTFDYPVDMSVKPDVTGFFDPETNTISYVVKDPNSNACAIIDYGHGYRLCGRSHKL